MRRHVDRDKLKRFMAELGRQASSPGTVYLTGGATALLLGIREQTVDIDVKLDPEPGGAFDAIAKLKERLGINVELAAPDDFIPALPGWKERSALVGFEGQVTFRHYDYYAQALAKIERGHARDLADAAALVECGLVDPYELARLFDAVRPDLVRYPALDAEAFAEKVRAFIREHGGG